MMRRSFIFFKNRKGQLMLEAMISITIAVTGILGLLSLLSQSLSLNRVINDQYIGSYLAAEGIEIAKNLIDKNIINKQQAWNAGLEAGQCYEVDFRTFALGQAVECDVKKQPPLNFDDATGLYSYQNGTPTAFRRIIQGVSSADGNEITVHSTVDWVTRGGGEFSLNVEDHFFNWQ